MITTENDKFYRGTQFQAFFRNSNRSLVLKADAPHFTILAVSDTYLALTHKHREELLERGLFEVYPGSAADLSEKNSAHSSFMRAINTKATDELPVFKYEIYIAETGKYVTEYWTNVNEPLLDDDGNVAYLINTNTNTTRQLNIEQALTEAEARLQSLNKELVAANEELAAGNEELTAANEEQTAINEELISTNDELKRTYSLLGEESAQRQLAIDALKVNENNLRNIVKQAPVGMCILQGDPLFVIEVNDIFLELIGKQREQFYTVPYWDVNAEAKAYYEPITNEVLASGISYHAKEHEIVLIRKGIPETVHVNFVYEPMLGTDGKPFALMIVAIDITDQVTARRKIESSEKHFRSLADIVPAKISNALPSGEVTFFNKKWLDYSGMNFEDLRDFGYHQMMHPDEIPEFQRRLGEAAANGVPMEMEMRFKDINGKYRWHLNIVSPVLDDNRQITMWVGSTTDIERIKEEEQRKNDFIGMVSHELKTPLTSLSAYLQMLQGKARKTGDSFTLGALDKSVNQIKKMTTMINGFLNVSRLESSELHIDKQQFDMAVLVKETEEESLTTITSHNVIFAPVETTIVIADRDKIGHVINNLISNAVKYSPVGSTIKVACVTINNNALVNVKDEGMGIASTDIDKLFDRYYRVEGSSMKSISGFGIGLYLSSEIIRRHDGKIGVESELGKGSNFWFTLPVVD